MVWHLPLDWHASQHDGATTGEVNEVDERGRSTRDGFGIAHRFAARLGNPITDPALYDHRQIMPRPVPIARAERS
ncbi:MAG TPA: hypothetical protein VHA73_11675 [Acidimicrobiales bacterium]|nr:hypothetical protein [Acidimicrobiales bacterium]